MKPIRKLYYNLTITSVSVIVALLIGSVEALGLIAEKLALSGGVWDWIAMLNEQFGALGYLIIGLFIVELDRVGRDLPLLGARQCRGRA